MDWSSIGRIIGNAAPLVGSLLGGPAGGAVGALVACALGADNDPASVERALSADPAALARVRELELTQRTELERLAVQSEANRLAADTASIVAVNQTMQAETAANDPWSRRWRPMVGFVFGGCLGVTVLAVAVAFVVLAVSDPTAALVQLPAFVGAMTALLTPAAGILGVTAWHRGAMQVAAVQTAKSP